MIINSFLRSGIIIIIFAFFGLNSFAQKTDIVVMKNGDQLTGEIEYLKVGVLNFSTDDMGTINIEWDKIQSITSINFYEIELEDGRVYYGSVGPDDIEGRIIVKGITIETALFMKYITRMNQIKDSFWDILDGYIKLGFSFTKASNIGQLSAGGNAKYRTKISLSELTMNSVITATEDEPTSRKQDLTFTYQHNMKDTWFAAGYTSLESNTELGIKLRSSIGGGVGNNFIQSGNQWMYAVVGISGNRESKTDESEAIYNIEGLINAQYQYYKYDHPKANLLTYLNVLPSLSNLGRFRFNYNIQLSWEIFTDFYWDLTYYIEYDSEPQSVDAAQTDYRIDTTIKYEF